MTNKYCDLCESEIFSHQGGVRHLRVDKSEFEICFACEKRLAKIVKDHSWKIHAEVKA